jgi:membrane protease YdiL (CAAX protease family)
MTQNRQRITWLLILAYLVLRLPLLAGVSIVFRARAAWLGATFEIGSYLLGAALIWWERDRLPDFHVGGLSLAIFILLKPIQTLLLLQRAGRARHPFAFPEPLSLALWAIALVLLVALWRDRHKLPRIRWADLGWLAIGIGAGILTAIALGYPFSYQVEVGGLPRLTLLDVFREAPWGFVYQLGYAAVSEEPVFRGFLWGSLRKVGWREFWILLFQTGLFALCHIYYIQVFPISFWIIVPAGALVFGLLVWGSRRISTTMGAHATMNALTSSVGALIAQLRA